MYDFAKSQSRIRLAFGDCEMSQMHLPLIAQMVKQ